MKKLTLLLVVLAACAGGGESGSQAIGAGSPEGAVTAFMAAAKAQDLQAMSSVWGDSKGLVRNSVDRTELEKRELIIMRLLCQEQFRVASKSAGVGGRQILQLEMKRTTKTELVKFVTVQGPADRWYVEDIPDLERLQGFCK